MINVACLNWQPFADILSGAKRTERRRRHRPDPRLERISPGEQVIFLEKGSRRAITATIVAMVRFDYRDGSCLYCIRIRNPRLTTSSRRHLQGWNRFER